MSGKFRLALAELIGTFAFIFIGAGSIITDSYTPRRGLFVLFLALAANSELKFDGSIF